MNPTERNNQEQSCWTANYHSLADWKVERGADKRNNVWAAWISFMVMPPLTLVAIFGLPIFIWEGHKGKVMQREGEAEGGVGRGWRGKGSESVPQTSWNLECGPNVRRYKAPINPPAYLLPASA